MAQSPIKLIPEKSLEKAVDILKAIGHHDRLQIVNILMKDECQVGVLVDILGKEESLISQQLSRLRLRGIVKSRRDGNKVYYSFANNSIKKIVKSIISES
ncbi:MAG: helix-turn-helix transcriptional regulator [Candidatus Latescibacteria bacterium]|nr:helix-turn-helix transcriptional regulator [Candidatus Latescibacterota bacterium]